MATGNPSTNLMLPTDHVGNDEPCFGYAEINKASIKAGGGVRRMQIIQVVRNDHLFEYWHDMGMSSDFKTEEFAFPGHIPLSNGHYEVLETVGRLKEAADEFRVKQDKPYRPFDPTDLVKGFEEHATRERESQTGRKMFSLAKGEKR